MRSETFYPPPSYAEHVEQRRRTNSFFFSWQALAVYIACVVWTPILPMRPLPPLRLDDLWLLIVVLAQVIKRRRDEGTRWHFGIVACGILALLTVVTNVLTRPTLSGFFQVGILIRYGLVMWVIQNIKWREPLLYSFQKSIMWIVCSTYIVIALQYFRTALGRFFTGLWTGFGEKYYGLETWSSSAARAIGTMGNPNSLGIVLAMAGLIALCCIFGKERTRHQIVLYILFFLTFVTVMYCTVSRTGFIAYSITSALAMVMALCTRSWPRGRIAMILLAVCALVTVSAGDFLLPKRFRLLTEVEGLWDYTQLEGPLGGRIAMWRRNWAELTSSPSALMWGVGIRTRHTVDNGLVKAFVAHGAVFGVAYLLLWGGALWQGFRSVFSGQLRDWANLRICNAVVLLLLLQFEFSADAFFNAKIGPLIVLFMGLVFTDRQNAVHFVNNN